jgi:hypothetical protein
MRKPRQFRPVVAEAQLEERVVLSITAARVVPTATPAQVSAELNGIHAALLSYSASVTNAILFAEGAINAGKVTEVTAINLLDTYIGNKTELLFYQVRTASARLPYGAGFNAFVNSTLTGIGDLPSGNDSLYALLTFPTAGGSGPIATLQNNVFTSVGAGDFAGAINDVAFAALQTTYQQVKVVTNTYVVTGVHAGDFHFS